MKLELHTVRLPLTPFTLEVGVRLDARVTGIFGASGAGKTSLLELVAGLRRPAAGTIRLDERVLSDGAARTFVPPERRAMGYVPQDGALFPHLNVGDNLRYGLQLPPRPDGPHFTHVAEVLEIAALANRAVGTLSGGERQRVALGRALLASPRLLLLDEPLAGLDAPLRERLLPYLVRVRDEFSIPMLYVTHSPDEVMALCDEVLLLEEGRIKRRGKPAGLFVASTAPRYVLRQSDVALPRKIGSDYLMRPDAQGHLKVMEALRKWDPIGVFGADSDWPSDEYDAYAAPVVSYLDRGASKEVIVKYLEDVCVKRMEVSFDRSRAEVIVDELLVFWSKWKKQLKSQ